MSYSVYRQLEYSNFSELALPPTAYSLGVKSPKFQTTLAMSTDTSPNWHFPQMAPPRAQIPQLPVHPITSQNYYFPQM